MPGNVEMAQILGVRFDNVSMDEALQCIRAFVQEGNHGSLYPNVDFLMLGRKDPAFRDIVNSADLNLCDSVPLRWASRLLGVRLKARIAGATCCRRPASWCHGGIPGLFLGRCAGCGREGSSNADSAASRPSGCWSLRSANGL